MMRFGKLLTLVALVAALGGASACQRTVEVQTGTRTVDSQGRVISEDIKTLRVPAETAGAYRINIVTQEDVENPQVAALYAAAQMAIATGDSKTAEQKLDAVIAISPSYRNAKTQLDAIKSGKKATPDTPGSAPATATTPPKKPKPAVDNPSALTRWTPDALAGFTASKAAVDPLSVSREYRPGSGNPAQALVIVAEQFRTSADAKRALTTNVKRAYPKNASSSKINGHTVYFGTDGRRFAAIGFTSGAVMVALEASPDSGSPSTMKSVLEKALKQLP